MKLLCDEMLQGLGRWLRTAGYDTAIAADGTADDVLLRVAASEHRILLTCDRALAEAAPDAARTVVLPTERLDPAAEEIRDRLGIDWLHRPFSRCLRCNTELRPAAERELAGLPEETRRGAGPFTACPDCARIYWPGSHVRRMRARLERWQAG